MTGTIAQWLCLQHGAYNGWVNIISGEQQSKQRAKVTSLFPFDSYVCNADNIMVAEVAVSGGKTRCPTPTKSKYGDILHQKPDKQKTAVGYHISEHQSGLPDLVVIGKLCGSV